MSEDLIDAYLDTILRAAGSSIRHYEAYSKDRMRQAMRTVLADAAKQQPAS